VLGFDYCIWRGTDVKAGLVGVDLCALPPRSMVDLQQKTPVALLSANVWSCKVDYIESVEKQMDFVAIISDALQLVAHQYGRRVGGPSLSR
jgi:hypothetical protein